MITLDTTALPYQAVYRYMTSGIVPRPIGWVSTVSAAGHVNLAPYSYCNAVCSNPPMVMFAGARDRHGRAKDSVRNAVETGEFVLNVVTHALAQRMAVTSTPLPPEENEFELAGLTMLPSAAVAPPRVGESPVHLECVVDRSLELGEGPGSATLVIGRVVLMHIDESVHAGDHIDPVKLDALGRLGGEAYCTTRDRLLLVRPS